MSSRQPTTASKGIGRMGASIVMGYVVVVGRRGQHEHTQSLYSPKRQPAPVDSRNTPLWASSLQPSGGPHSCPF